MTTSTEIDMVQCPYCNNTFVQADLDLVCSTCAPRLQTDLCLNQVLESVANLEELPRDYLKDRMNILSNALERLKKLKKEISK